MFRRLILRQAAAVAAESKIARHHTVHGFEQRVWHFPFCGFRLEMSLYRFCDLRLWCLWFESERITQ